MATFADFNPYENLEERDAYELEKVPLEELSRITSHDKENEDQKSPWYFSEKLYFFFAGSNLYLCLEFTASTLGVYELNFKAFIYTFYAFLSLNLANLAHPLLHYFLQKTHFRFQISFSYFMIYFFTLWIAFAGIFFKGERWAFYSILFAQFCSMTFCYTGQNFVTKTFSFYDPSCIAYYYSPVCFWIVIITGIGIPMSYFEVSNPIQILVVLSIVTLIFLYAFILHRHISTTDYYEVKQEEQKQENDKITWDQIVDELKSIFWYFFMLISCVTSAATVFPSMIAEFKPPGMSYMTWVNIISSLGNTIYALSTFLSLSSLNSNLIQHTFVSLCILFSIVVSLTFCGVLKFREVNSPWLWFFVFCMFMKMELGYYLSYSMGKALSMTKSKAGIYLMNGAINTGYLLGCILAVWIAELSKRREIHFIRA